MYKTTLMTLLTLLFCGSTALAAGTMRVDFQELDANGDGQLTKEEARGNDKLIKRWDAIDANDDDLLSETEVKEAEKPGYS